MTRVVAALLLSPQAYLTVLALFSKSRDPLVLGRYSHTLLLFNVALLGMTGVLVAGVRGRRFVLAAAALVGLLLLSYPLGTNNQILASALAVPAIVLSRIGLAGALLLVSGLAWSERSRAARPLLALGSTLLALTLADGAALAIVPRAASSTAGGFDFRQPVDLKAVAADGIAIVGDSFVFGSGVEEDEAFPAVLARRLGDRSVYNLGLPGTSLPEYLAVLRALPPMGRAVVCFYMNDLPSRQTRALMLAQLLAGARRTSVFCRLASDFVSMRELPDVDVYETWIVGDYDRSDPTFGRRWSQLEADLRAIAIEARRVSRSRPPLFVVFPLMQRFSEYPLVEAHRDLDAFATSLGFDVLDMLPVFTREFPDGRSFRTAPNDGHFNAAVHAEVARRLAERFSTRPLPEPAGK